MIAISANELKTKGVSLIAKKIKKEEECAITVHGVPQYVVVDVERYSKLREDELLAALAETRKSIKEGKYVVESVNNHIKRVKKMMKNV